MVKLVSFLKTNSLTILAVSLLIGLFFPTVSTFFRPWLTGSVFIFLLGIFLRVDLNAIQSSLRQVKPTIIFPLTIMVFLPIITAWGLSYTTLETGLIAAIVLSLACPPSTGNAAIAREMKSDHSSALVIIFICTLIAPITVPLIAEHILSLSISTQTLARNIGALVGGAVILSAFILLKRRSWTIQYGAHLDVITVLALSVFALATMHNVRDQILANPKRAIILLCAIYAINLFSFFIGLFLANGTLKNRSAFGISTANRNVGLIWAALGLSIDPTIAFYFALSQFPIFTLPVIFNKAVSLSE